MVPFIPFIDEIIISKYNGGWDTFNGFLKYVEVVLIFIIASVKFIAECLTVVWLNNYIPFFDATRSFKTFLLIETLLCSMVNVG